MNMLYKPNDPVRDLVLVWADRGMIQLILELKPSQNKKGHNFLGKFVLKLSKGLV